MKYITPEEKDERRNNVFNMDFGQPIDYPEMLEESEEDNDVDQITITIYQCYTVVALFCIVSILAILGWVK